VRTRGLFWGRLKGVRQGNGERCQTIHLAGVGVPALTFEKAGGGGKRETKVLMGTFKSGPAEEKKKKKGEGCNIWGRCGKLLSTKWDILEKSIVGNKIGGRLSLPRKATFLGLPESPKKTQPRSDGGKRP